MRASAVVKRQLTVVAAALRETLARQSSEFDLGHIQPTPMQRGVMDFQFGRETTRFGGREGVVKGGRGVSGEVVHHQDDFLGVGILDVDHVLHEMGKSLGSFSARPP
jgi:hypothetical protein